MTAPSSEFGFEDGSWIDHLRAARNSREKEPPAGTLGTIGEYVLIERVGQGAQGTVYKARQPRTGRIVAIKRIALADGADARSRARFEREVETASSLRHAGIVTVHEVLSDVAAIVMTWIDGVSADEWSDRRRPGSGAARDIVRTVKLACEALAYAHGRGVIHRDIKPSNVLIDADGRPHVVDFGLARELEGNDTLTLAGGFAGTPEYAPPEQIERGLHEADVRADVYAIGALLYRMLTGRNAFAGESLAALFDSVRRGDPPAPSSVAGCADDLDDELDAIVLMAMRPDRDDRYATMTELAEDLDRWLDRRAVRARRATPAYYARAFVRRHPASVTAAGAALIIIVGLSITAGVASVSLASERSRLKRTLGQRDEALQQVTVSERLALSELSKSRSTVAVMFDIVAAGRNSPEVIAALERKAESLDNPSITLIPEIEISTRLALARMYHRLDRDGRALDQARRIIEMGGTEASNADVIEAGALIGEISLEQGRPAEAIEPLRSAARAASGPDISRAHLLLVEALVKAGKLDEAQELVSGFPPTPGPAGPFMAARVRSLCDELGLDPPRWARDETGQ
jgi:serine/threonine protein kinase